MWCLFVGLAAVTVVFACVEISLKLEHLRWSHFCVRFITKMSGKCDLVRGLCP